jgi:ABC-type transport system involved in multi-copper enzyme maturation permease subunit
MTEEGYDTHKLFVSFDDAVTLGLGIAIGTFIAYLAVALIVGLVVGIVFVISGATISPQTR